MIYFTSDLHFRHQNILKYCEKTRPFSSIEEHDAALIRNWNEIVSPEDIVYVLGDFCMGEISVAIELVKQLNGKIILIRGNHDYKKRCDAYKSLGIEIKDIDYIQYKGRFLILNHFPIASPEFINMVREDNSECIILYGHVHDKAPKGYHCGTFHVGVDTNDLRPISIEEIWKQSWGEVDIQKEPYASYIKEHNSEGEE